MFKQMGGRVKGFLKNVKKTALFLQDGFPNNDCIDDDDNDDCIDDNDNDDCIDVNENDHCDNNYND